MTGKIFRKEIFFAGNKGLTLLEVMVVTLLSTVLFAGVYMTFIFGYKTSRHYSQNVKARQQVRLALNWMTYELREARNVFLVEERDELRLTFFKKKIGQVCYVWTKTGEEKGVLRRIAPMKNRILARDIDELLIFYPKSDTLEFQISSGKTDKKDQYQVLLKGQVTLRGQMTTMRLRGRHD